MTVTMTFVDHKGTQHEITDPDPIEQERKEIVERLTPHKRVLESGLPLSDTMVVRSMAAAPPLLNRLHELAVYAERWNGLVDAAEVDLRRRLVEAISAWEDQT